MTSVEAAASLFGPEDASSDPFASLGGEPFPQIHSEEVSFGETASNVTGIGNYPLDAHTQLNSADYSTSLGPVSETMEQPVLYNGEAHAQSYEAQHTKGSIAERTTYRAQQNYSNNNGYDPYTPLAAANTSVAAVSEAYQQTQYNAYAPASNNYALSSQAAPPSTATYTPYGYAPATQPTPAQYVHSASTPPVRAGATVTVPPPPPSTAPTVNRPKPNAYDPPFPTSSRFTKRGTRTASGPTYGYGAHEPLPPPPASSYFPTMSSHVAPHFSQLPLSGPSPPPQSLPPPPQRPPAAPPTQAQNSSYEYGSNGLGNGTYMGTMAGNHSRPPSWDRGHGSTPWNSTMEATVYDRQQPISQTASPYEQSLAGQPPRLRPRPSQSPNNTQYQPPQALPEKPSQPRVSSPVVSPPQPSASSLPPINSSEGHLSQWSGPNGDSGPFSDLSASGTNVSPTQFDVKGTHEVMTSELGRYVSAEDDFADITARPTPVSHLITTEVRTSFPAPDPSMNGKPESIAGPTNPYLPHEERVASPANSLRGELIMGSDPYAPKNINGKEERAKSPGSFSVRSSGEPPAPRHLPQGSRRQDRNRSTSNSSLLSSSSQDGIYAPSHPTKRTLHESDYTSRYGTGNGHEANHLNEHGSQELLLKPFHTSYAPSPSLLGANDPLGRTSARIPVFSFGFGGKIATCFHGADSFSTGFDVALSTRHSTGIRVRTVKQIVPEAALDNSTASFPGPLFCDPGTQATSLVRAGTTSQTKSKKTRVIQYLSERTEELGLGLRYLRPDSVESGRAEGKIVLMKILRLMVEHDGRLTGTADLDAALRTALVPKLEGTLSDQSLSTSGFTAPVDSPSYLPAQSQPNDATISTTNLCASQLEKIQDFLLRGERKQAYHYALDEKLWAHAMVISSSIDKEAWKEVVNEFLRSELGVQGTVLSPSKQPSQPVNGREALRVAYSLFSGQGAAAVQELSPQNLLTKTNRLHPVPAPHLTPRTPKFSAGAPPAAPISLEILKQWPEMVAMMLSYPLPQETYTALTNLGDQLAANQLIEAAHVCYLLAPQTSPMGGIGHPSARVVLVGSRSPQIWPNFSRDSDSIIFSEIVEFALSLAPTTKGQEPFSGIPHLQAYRFIRAMSLVEYGDMQQANRYCEAIAAAINRSSPYVTTALLEQLQGLSERIAGVIQPDKSFWTGAKISKPSLDTIGGWLEGRFTKLVTGDSEAEKPQEAAKPDSREFSGPFSHYSTISSATPSARSSPQPSVLNYHTLPPVRSGSAMAYSSPYQAPQIDRASSAMDYVRRKQSPAPRLTAANPSSSNASSAGQPSNILRQDNYSTSDDLVTPRPSLTPEPEGSNVQETGWWGSTVYDEGSAAQTPTAATFVRVDQGALTQSSDGFISLMDDASYAVASQPPVGNGSRISHDSEDIEDLGFGNSKPKPKPASMDEGAHESSAATKEPVKAVSPAVQESEETRPVPATSGWFSRWWKKSDAPVRANLGDQSDFYFDKDLGRWVNRKAGAEPPKPAAPPPPPSRAQTASPGMTGSRLPGVSDSTTPPPARSASAIDLSTSPPSRTVMRVRSNLVPPPDSAPSTPTGTRLAPAGRPRSQASKRNTRSRYVNVFQDGSGA